MLISTGAAKWASVLIQALGPKNWYDPEAWDEGRDKRIRNKINSTFRDDSEDFKEEVYQITRSFWLALSAKNRKD
jgi:hypothetical protein